MASKVKVDTIESTSGTSYLDAGVLDNVALGSSVTGRTGWQLLSSVTASNQANVEFAGTLLSSTYDNYMIKIASGVAASDNQQLQMKIAQSGTYKTSAYAFFLTLQYAGSVHDNRLTNASHTNLVLAQSVGNASGEGYDFTIYFSNPTAANYPRFYWLGTCSSISNTITRHDGVGQLDVVASFNKIKFCHGLETVNIASGIFSLYGLPKS